MNMNKIAQTRANVGQLLSCKYPKNGKRNILCNQTGQVIDDGFSVNGHWYKIQRADGSYRTLNLNKMVQPTITN